MKFKRIIKKVLQYAPEYDSFYPEHKPISEKLKDMEVERLEHYLEQILIRTRTVIKRKHVQFNEIESTAWFRTIYWCLDFDVTEAYIWDKASKNM